MKSGGASAPPVGSFLPAICTFDDFKTLGGDLHMSKHGMQRIGSAMMVMSAMCGVAFAEDEPAKPAAPAAPALPALADLLTAWGITESGYVAASYFHSNGYNTDHEFDDKHDTFQLDQAALTLAYQPKEGFGALVNVAAGEDMKILNAAEGNNPNVFDIIQGYAQYATGPLTVIGGKFVTLAGAEVIAPTGNTNFSRSFLFYAEPLTHTGVRATYAASDTFSVIVGVNNGWNYSSLSTSGSKTGEFGLAFSLTVQGYAGKDPTYDAPKTFIDAVATYNVTGALSFVLSYDWGQQKQQPAGDPTLEWNGAAFYTNYAISDQWRVSVRVEYLDDKNGLITGTAVAQTLKEGTVTFGYDPIKNFELRIEGRYDMSTQDPFVRTISPSTGLPSTFANSQTEFALQGVYKF
jgi:Putative beta-barrel porin-2, OmpL-like. bbp2